MVDDLKRWLDRNHLLLNESKTEVIGLYRENAIAIESEARDPFGGNVYYVTMQILFPIPDRSDPDVAIKAYRPLSRRLDRYDRVIQNESRDPFGGNVYYVTM